MAKNFIKLFLVLYFSILVFSFVTPFFITGGFWLHFIHYGTIAFLFSLGILVFIMSQIEIFKAKSLKKENQQDFAAFTKELIETYKHMGTVNRQLEMTKSLISSSALSKEDLNPQGIKNLLQNILDSAAFSVASSWAVLRFINVEQGRTLTEFSFNNSKKEIPNISNTALIDYLNHKKWSKNYFFVIPDEREREIVAFIIMPKNNKVLEADDSFLKIFVNQAQLIFLAFRKTITKVRKRNAGTARG